MYSLAILTVALAVSGGLCTTSFVPPAEEFTVPVTSQDVIVTGPPLPTERILPTEPGSDPGISTSVADVSIDTASPTATSEDTMSDIVSASMSEDFRTDDFIPVPTTTTSFVSTAIGQTLTETSITAPVSTSTSEPVSVSLEEATLGENAEFAEIDGKPAIVLSPPAWEQASLSISATAPEGRVPGGNIQVRASISVTEFGSTIGKRWNVERQGAGEVYRLKISVDGAAAYDKELTASPGPIDVTSNPVPSTDKPQVGVTLQAGESAVEVRIHDLSLAAEDSSEGPGQSAATGSGGSSGANDRPQSTSGDERPSSTALPPASTSDSGSGTGGQVDDDDSLASSIFSRSRLEVFAISVAASLLALIV